MNHLTESTSPYLLQHASNPVDWFPWEKQALEKARSEKKPIFLSIGYAACHWCHVMAHESFEDPEIARLMNELFINIKVDREERPDLDAIYMQAATSMTGSGGWPLSIFLTPDLEPFFAGTYFPPVSRYNLPSFKEVLLSIARSWREERDKILTAGGQIKQNIEKVFQVSFSREGISNNLINDGAASLISSYDWEFGGWGSAPKFPQAMALDFLLSHALINHEPLDGSVKLVNHNLNAMSLGGMYDVLGGGFSRYSTDIGWRVPHFEKMLYDNALLVRCYLHAWVTSHEPIYRQIVIETLDFISREMTHPQGGFYSSLDADSEGIEGKYYVWTHSEIKTELGSELDFFEAAYGVSARGNWEGNNVLQRVLDDASLAAKFKMDPADVSKRIMECRTKLLSRRQTRIRPATDDKIITSWNGLMLRALAEAAIYLDDRKQVKQYYDMATRNAGFLMNFLCSKGSLHRSWRDGKVTAEVFLDDYAALILGLLELYQADFNPEWFSQASALLEEMILRFKDPGGGFFDVPDEQISLLVKPKDMLDTATPSGNSLACEALIRMAALTGNDKYREMAEQSISLISALTQHHPVAFSHWLSAAELITGSLKEVAIINNPADDRLTEMLTFLRSRYRPNMMLAVSSYPPDAKSPALLLDRKPENDQTTAFVCENFVCQLPVTSTAHLLEQIKN